MAREALGTNCKFVELKVIAVATDQMPSEVAYHRYEMREHLRPRPPLEHRDLENIKQVSYRHMLALKQNEPEMTVEDADQAASVQESPSLSEGDVFGAL